MQENEGARQFQPNDRVRAIVGTEMPKGVVGTVMFITESPYPVMVELDKEILVVFEASQPEKIKLWNFAPEELELIPRHEVDTLEHMREAKDPRYAD